VGLITLTVKNKLVTKNHKELRIWTDFLDKRLKRRITDMRLGTWNTRSLYRADSLITVSKERSGYRLDLVGMQEVKWEGSGTTPAGEYTFFYGKGNETHVLGIDFFYIR
jgi:hypothetical protein